MSELVVKLANWVWYGSTAGDGGGNNHQQPQQNPPGTLALAGSMEDTNVAATNISPAQETSTRATKRGTGSLDDESGIPLKQPKTSGSKCEEPPQKGNLSNAKISEEVDAAMEPFRKAIHGLKQKQEAEAKRKRNEDAESEDCSSAEESSCENSPENSQRSSRNNSSTSTEDSREPSPTSSSTPESSDAAKEAARQLLQINEARKEEASRNAKKAAPPRPKEPPTPKKGPGRRKK